MSAERKTKDVYDEVADLLSLVARLAPEDGLFDGEYGCCMYCDDPGIRENRHSADCPWIEAQVILKR